MKTVDILLYDGVDELDFAARMKRWPPVGGYKMENGARSPHSMCKRWRTSGAR